MSYYSQDLGDMFTHPLTRWFGLPGERPPTPLSPVLKGGPHDGEVISPEEVEKLNWGGLHVGPGERLPLIERLADTADLPRAIYELRKYLPHPAAQPFRQLVFRG